MVPLLIFPSKCLYPYIYAPLGLGLHSPPPVGNADTQGQGAENKQLCSSRPSIGHQYPSFQDPGNIKKRGLKEYKLEDRKECGEHCVLDMIRTLMSS